MGWGDTRGETVGRTLAQKVWDQHVVRPGGTGDGEDAAPDLLYIDRHLVHEVTSPQALKGLRLSGLPSAPARTSRLPPRTMTSADDRPFVINDPLSLQQINALQGRLRRVRHHLLERPGQRPAGDRPHRRAGAGDHPARPDPRLWRLVIPQPTARSAAWPLASALRRSSTCSQRRRCRRRIRPKAIAVERETAPGDQQGRHPGVIAKIGTGGGTGYVVEYRGYDMRATSMEARMTICNMSIEGGARAGMIAPDEKTFAYLKGRPHAPQGERVGRGPSRTGARCSPTPTPPSTGRSDLDVTELTPFVTWGTIPARACRWAGRSPIPKTVTDPNDRCTARRALAYMGLRPGTDARHPRRHRLPRIVHQRPHRGPARRRRCLPRRTRSPNGVGCSWCPDRRVQAQAEAEGLDEVFTAAGAEWRRPAARCAWA